ncbi:ead/Ea22-like family protein [Salmonella enterica]|uniref:Ead/Ea22-like family protein n=3 Tax=Salmonella enterica TaxID=28901 RepID=A0A606YVC2_SALET|nr:ead/Ea22-like family protein [Salmonella enterica]EAB6707751.1 ead/Ea22-like family protein [Salmonella enterica subsp. enterica serovar Brandenburg]EAY3108583.1 ead/Ea22-like family protein [Salmonella enterica subsp. enterica serovar Typhimurium]ECF3037396.1 ead/Ea22-like family protein [Salmonella enterica subsp. enterica serovar Brancaster]ECO0718901.1 ead/Ea22-like family protein [Salmonella enterica subsp. enterica serovar Schwarzengrund]ECT1181935.1 ead/Ea22-like family protein [Salm
MSNIDKQAVTAKTKELASLMVERFSMNPVSCKLLNEAWKKEFPDEVAIAERMLALLDEPEHYKSREERVTKLVLDNSTSWDALYKKLEAAEKRIAELTDQKATWVTWAENASGMVDMLRLRIAELEHSETQLINERDAAESALADMYQAATGERPEWSNMFGFADAVDVVEERLATLEANQSQTTPTGIQLITEAIGAHGYIVGCLLQGRPDLALEESRKWVSAFGQAAEIVSAQDADDIKVKGD